MCNICVCKNNTPCTHIYRYNYTHQTHININIYTRTSATWRNHWQCPRLLPDPLPTWCPALIGPRHFLPLHFAETTLSLTLNPPALRYHLYNKPPNYLEHICLYDLFMNNQVFFLNVSLSILFIGMLIFSGDKLSTKEKEKVEAKTNNKKLAQTIDSLPLSYMSPASAPFVNQNIASVISLNIPLPPRLYKYPKLFIDASQP
jgi:hypothetical protein